MLYLYTYITEATDYWKLCINQPALASWSRFKDVGRQNMGYVFRQWGSTLTFSYVVWSSYGQEPWALLGSLALLYWAFWGPDIV